MGLDQNESQSRRESAMVNGRYVVLIAYGLVIGAIVFIVCAKAGYFSDNSFIYRFQTLIGAIIAIGAAAVGGSFVYNQTQSQRAIENKKAHLREVAARAKLPHLLSKVNEYAEESMRVWNTLAGDPSFEANNRILWAEPPELCAIEPDLINDLADAVESAGSSSQEALFELLVALQVHEARARMWMKGIKRGGSDLIVLPQNIDSAALDTAAIYALNNTIYNYARRIDDDAPATPTLGDVHNAVSSLHYVRDWCLSLDNQDPNEAWTFVARQRR